VSGTVKLDATSAAQGSYTLGAVTVVDDPPQGAARLAGETRTALRERIRCGRPRGPGASSRGRGR
jgi:hypothetical protein